MMLRKSALTISWLILGGILRAQTATTTTLTSITPSTPLFGEVVTLTAHVSPASAPGTVSFMDGGILVGVGTLNASGIAQTKTITLPTGTHSIRAVYGGKGGYLASHSAAQTYVVTAVPGGDFGAPASYAVGTGLGPVGSVALGDFNGDGKADLVVTNYPDSSVSVLLGNGDGTFQSKVDYSAGPQPVSVAVGDFNGDGKVDLVVANGNDGPSNVSVLLGNGDGTFQAAANYSVGSLLYPYMSPASVAVGDFNGDGKADLATANQFGNVSVLLGNGDGTFETAAHYPAGAGAVAVAVGDFNGDGKADLVTVNYADNSLSVLLGNGDGTFQASVNYTLATFPYVSPDSVAVADFNGDGKADLAVANASAGSVSVLLGKGDGTFQAKVDYPAGTDPTSVLVGDFNGDGKADLATADSGGNNVNVLLGNGNGTFQTAMNYGAGTGPRSMVVGDFNGDGKADLVVTNNTNNVSVLLGQPPPVPNDVAVTSSPSGAAFTVSGTGCAPGSYATPANLVWNVSTDCSVYFPNQQQFTGLLYVFGGSTVNGGSSSIANPRSIRSGSISFTINATFVAPPVGGTVSPNSGSGSAQTFTGTLTAASGYQDLQFVQMLLAVATDGGGQPFCLVHYDVQANRFWLYSDVLGFFLGPIAPGTPSNLLQGSLCALNTSGSSVFGSGADLTINANVVFKQALALNLYVRGYTLEGIDTGWVQKGTWTTAAASVGTMTVTPSSGSVASGTQQIFTLTYPDPPGFAGAAFGWEQFLVATATDGGGNPFCYVHYDRTGNGLWMYSGDVGFFLGPVTPGTASSLLTSSACSINTASATVANTSGNLVLTVPIVFKSPMVRANNLYQRTADVLNRVAEFAETGTFTVN